MHALCRLHVFHAQIEMSIKSTLDGFLLQMLLRSLCEYILYKLIEILRRQYHIILTASKYIIFRIGSIDVTSHLICINQNLELLGNQ